MWLLKTSQSNREVVQVVASVPDVVTTTPMVGSHCLDVSQPDHEIGLGVVADTLLDSLVSPGHASTFPFGSSDTSAPPEDAELGVDDLIVSEYTVAPNSSEEDFITFFQDYSKSDELSDKYL